MNHYQEMSALLDGLDADLNDYIKGANVFDRAITMDNLAEPFRGRFDMPPLNVIASHVVVGLMRAGAAKNREMRTLAINGLLSLIDVAQLYCSEELARQEVTA
jgi:hypothetical protein